MNSPAFLLAIALPAASAIARGVTATTQAVGDGFRGALESASQAAGGQQAEELSGEPNGEPKGEPSLREKLGALAADLQAWLRDQGVADDYSIDYQLESSGEQQLDVAGTAAEQVKQLLATQPDWLNQLRQIAASLQAQTSVLSRGSSLEAANIAISDLDFRMS